MKRTTAIAAAAALVLLAFALPARAQNIGTVMGDTMTYRNANTTKPKIEATSHVTVLDKDLTSPPGSPTDGTWYLVPPTGWSGLHANDEARYSTLLGWSYLTPSEGWVVWVADENRTYTFHDGVWGAEAGSGDASGPSSSTDNALARFDGTTGKLLQNSAATLTDAGAMAWTNSSTSSALSIVQTGTTSGLLSGPAAFQLNLDADVGAGFGIVTSAAYTGHPFQIYSTNVAAAISAAYIQSWGVRPSLQVEHFGSGSTVGNAALIYSENASDSSLGVIGHESARGTAKIRHIDPGGDDHNASVLSLKNDGATTEAQGIFYDCDSPPGVVGTDDACGKILNLRVQNVEKFVLDSIGNTVQTGEMRSYSARIEPLTGNTLSASPSVGGQLLLRGTENDGAMAVLYTDNDADASGDMVSIWADNAAFDRNLMSLTQDGTAPGIVVTQNSETASANALQLISHNDLASTGYFQGEELGLGTLRVHHIYSSGDDHNSAALVLTNAGASSASMGLFMDLVSTGTGALFNIRSGGTERLKLLPSGYLTVTSDDTAHGFLLDQNANTSASTSVGGAFLLENTGNSGAAEVIYSNHATATARLLSVRADNVGYGGEVVAIDNDGTNNALRLNQNSSNAGANAMLVSSLNASDSAVEITDVALTQPSLKITHTATSGDSTSSGVFINLAGTGTAARGLFIDSTGVTTGNLLDLRNNGSVMLSLGPTGTGVVTGTWSSDIQDAGGDTTTFPLLATAATGSLAPKTDAGLAYNASTNVLTATGFVGSLTGTASSTNALQSATTTVNVSSATAPTAGQVLTATGGSAATWQTPAGVVHSFTRTFAFDDADIDVASSSVTIDLAAIPGGAVVVSAYADNPAGNTPYTDGDGPITTVTAEFGGPFSTLPIDIHTSLGDFDPMMDGIAMPGDSAPSPTTITMHIEATGGDLSTLAAGEFTARLVYVEPINTVLVAP